MTYRNATHLAVSLILSCSALSSLGGAWAVEPTPATAAVRQSPSLAAPSSEPDLRQKTAVPAETKLSPPAPLPKVPVATISQDSRPTLDANTFINTMRAAWTYKRIAEAGGWPSLPDGTIMKVGDKGPLVPVLRQRLIAEGDLSPEFASGTTFDTALLSAVKRFQARHGLSESGAVRARTLEALNVSAVTRHRQLTASAQRLAGSTFSFGDRYAVVNIPSAAVEAVEQGQVARRYVAIVGKVDRPSPTVETRVTAVNLNPTWTVPVSLIKKDIIPHVRNDPDYLQKMKIRILDAKGQEVDPKAIDWSTQSAVNYTLRQDPGAINSLGQIRIDMPNKHAVYMHDTPKKQLFAQDIRFHSSGCVRVADVGDFAEWLLRGTNGSSGAWTKADIDTAIASTARQDIRLDKPVPVAWVYLTGYATADGTVHFRNDVYGLDMPRTDPVSEQEAIDVPATASIKTKRL
ncbi:L,D-transpeptidase family protein [Microvirga sp. BT290]|uniref:L,D-transpeptidase family protein n=1 Tax=Microvirga terrestris TaxID=2791024 RepID=A0ABS0HMW0_9HYPH|nr:L,D-transpeptidase family protein [Microvirga terrestris]MBF9194709.1 L,D-transpeptidase family protein [Microvirga terrestris]